MRCVIQRVAQASVSVAGEQIGTIQQGFMVLIGVSTDDTDHDVHYMAEKVPNLRIFEDEAGKMNRSLKDVGGAILAVSQFTLYGDARGGRRLDRFEIKGALVLREQRNVLGVERLELLLHRDHVGGNARELRVAHQHDHDQRAEQLRKLHL